MAEKFVIESKIRRPGGTKVTMRRTGNSYHFKPRGDDNRHTDVVENKTDMMRFMQVGMETGSFELLGSGPDGETGGGGAKGAIPPTTENGDDQKGDDQKGDKPDQDDAADGTAALDNLTDDEIRALFEDEIGRKPHGKAGRDTMIAQIEDKRKGA